LDSDRVECPTCFGDGEVHTFVNPPPAFCPRDHTLSAVVADQRGGPLVLTDVGYCDACGIVKGPDRRRVFLYGR
jgi:hypothetical protein